MKIGIEACGAKRLIVFFIVLFAGGLAAWAASLAVVNTPSGWRHLALMYSITEGAWWLVTRSTVTLALLGILCLFCKLWRMAFVAFGLAAVAFALVLCAIYATRSDAVIERHTSVVMREPDEVEVFGRTYKGKDAGYFAWQMQGSIGFRWSLVAEVELQGNVTVGKFFSSLCGFSGKAFKSVPQCIVRDYDAYVCSMRKKGEHPVCLRVGEHGEILDADAFAEAVRNACPIVLEIDEEAGAVSLERAVGRVAESGAQEVYVSRAISSGARDDAIRR